MKTNHYPHAYTLTPGRKRLSFVLLLLSCLLYTVAGAAQSTDFRSYKVKKGDTLQKIANKYKCSLEEVAKPNKIKAPKYVIHPGKKLKIPHACKGKPKAAPSRKAKARQKKTVGPRCPSGRYYTVRKGDRLGRIAKVHGKTTRALQRVNHIRDVNVIIAGKKLCIPGTEHSAICDWNPKHTDQKSLRSLMTERYGFQHRGSKKFRAMVVELTLDGTGQNAKVTSQKVYDYNGKSEDSRGWNPASTVKLFSALAAVTRARENGIGWNTSITFHDKRTEKTTLKKLVHDALSLSNNIAHDRLAQFAGFDFMHTGSGGGDRGFFKNHGLRNTYLMRAYAQSSWKKVAHSKSFRDSPKITSNRHTFKARHSKSKVPCYGAACTSLSDLSRAMCRFMLHEQLDITGEVFDFDDDFTNGKIRPSSFIWILRKSLQGQDERGKQTQRRGRNVIKNLRKGFKSAKRGFADNMKFFHKPGYARKWFSDVVYIMKPGKKRWIVAMAGYPGRHSVDKAAAVIGKIIANGDL